MKKIFLTSFTFIALISFNYSIQKKEKPKVCITFDDGSVNDMPGYTSAAWNTMLLQTLQKHKLQTVFFAAGIPLDNEKGRNVLDSWSKQGHWIANHTYSHKSYGISATTYDFFTADFLKNDSLINKYKTYAKLFRFPYLKEGDTKYKRDEFRAFLESQGYRNGYVTIDASDWYVNSRLLKRLKENANANISGYKKFYLEHIFERASYYNDLSLKITGRQINHSLLLHHNLTSALFIDDLIKMFKEKGWEVVNASEAYKDEIYKKNHLT